MRPLLLILLLVLSCALICDLGGVTTSADVQWSLFDSPEKISATGDAGENPFVETSFPVTLLGEKPQSLVGFIYTKGYSITGVLDIVVVGNEVTLGHYDKLFHLAPDKDNCDMLDSGSFTCRVLLHTQSESLDIIRLYSPDDSPVTIPRASFRAARMKRVSVLEGNIIYAYFFFLAITGPIFFFLRRRKDADLYVLIMVSSLFCVILNVISFAFIVVTVVLLYLMIIDLQKRRIGKKKTLISLVVISIFLLAVVKILLPYIGYIFTDPGRFFFILPLGFSYFIIRFVDLSLNVYSGYVKEVRFIDFVSFMFFPATLPAGPIFMFDEFLSSKISNYNVVDYSSGIARVTYGILKKIFADTAIYPFVLANTNIFIVDPSGMESSHVLKFLVANTFFVFLDFSAYSDMAIGAGRAMGWKVPENFNFPLLQSRLRNFWQCWHMTLSNWVMRRVYMSAIMSSRSIALSTFASMLTIGLWHTVNLAWSFWALHHSMIMTLERYVIDKIRWPKPFPQTRWALFLTEKGKLAVGICLVWFWVSLGHCFTLFSDIELAFEAYLSALQGPIMLIVKMFSS